jgi:hypothetical protein
MHDHAEHDQRDQHFDELDEPVTQRLQFYRK